MENSPRDEMHYPIDFNAQMALAAFYLAELADIINDKESNYSYKKAYFSLKTKINALMWDERDGFYYDLDEHEKRLKVKTIASFWPLIAEIPNEARGERLIEHLVDPHEFGIENPFPTSRGEGQAVRPSGQRVPRLGLSSLQLHGDQGAGEIQKTRPGPGVRHPAPLSRAGRAVHQQRQEGLSLRGVCPAHGGTREVAGEEGFPPYDVSALHGTHHASR